MSALLEKILSRDNMFAALDKVKANKGAGGIDGISVNEIDQYLKENWVDIRDKIRKRKYTCCWSTGKRRYFILWKILRA